MKKLKKEEEEEKNSYLMKRECILKQKQTSKQT